MRAYLVDDEPLAISRLRRLLEAAGHVDVVGASTKPAAAAGEIQRLRPDVLFLDIQMPGQTGFELLERLGTPQPCLVFTTAYAEYALDAFTVDSVDYLMKPITEAALTRALAKVERALRGGGRDRDLTALIDGMRSMLAGPDRLTRVASRTGDRVELVDVADVRYFLAEDKLTVAVTRAGRYPLDLSIADLERRLPARQWVRIHRSTLLSVDAVKALHTRFGRLLVRLKDGTELQVARDRAADVRARLGL
jgi:DNA-binding LytR/AlgR family response regulator